jgi:sucrose synthase
MLDLLSDIIRQHREQVYLLLRSYFSLGRSFLLRSDLWDQFEEHCGEIGKGNSICTEAFKRFIVCCQEAILEDPWIYFAVRERIGRWVYVRFHVEALEHEEVSVSQFLAFKERIVAGPENVAQWPLELDFGPFNREFPRMREVRSIGRGVEFLNRRLSSQLFQSIGQGDRKLLDFLRVHQYQGQQLMLNDRIVDVPSLLTALRRAEDYLSSQDDEASWDAVKHVMQSLGFEPGWGNTVA